MRAINACLKRLLWAVEKSEIEGVDWAVQWLPEGGELTQEGYVNLIPTSQGGTHVNGLRSGLLDALREFCEIRALLPRGVKLGPEDIWDRCCFVLSVKMQDPSVFWANQRAVIVAPNCGLRVW